MKLVSRFLFLTLGLCVALIPWGCAEESSVDCSLVLCVGNEPVYLEITVDGENLLSRSDYLPSDITIRGKGGISPPELQLLTGLIGASEALLELRNYDWTAGATYEYVLKLAGDWQIPLALTFADSRGGCCGGSLRISALTSSDFLVEKQPGGFYRLVLE